MVQGNCDSFLFILVKFVIPSLRNYESSMSTLKLLRILHQDERQSMVYIILCDKKREGSSVFFFRFKSLQCSNTYRYNYIYHQNESICLRTRTRNKDQTGLVQVVPPISEQLSYKRKKKKNLNMFILQVQHDPLC